MQELLILCALEEEFSKEGNRYADNIFYTGVGKINSCITTLELIKEKNPSLIVNVGTVGACRDDIEGIIECGVFKDRDDTSEFNSENIIYTDNNLLTISTGDNFISHKVEGCDVVDMEAYAIAKVCKRYNVDFKCYKYVSDNADENAGDKWKENINKGCLAFVEKIKSTYEI